ncbi:MAG: hypothetical protein AB4352_05820 [Hormoscilla sp.]
MVEEIIIYILGRVLTGVISGLITSTLIYQIVSRFKPNVEISPEISKDQEGDGRVLYRIKVINRTKADIVNIRAQLHLLKRGGQDVQVKGGLVVKNQKLELKQSDPLFIEKYSAKDPKANYAYRFITYEELSEKWDRDTQRLRFRIICTHAFTGVTKFFEKEYDYYNIKNGNFCKGDSFEITQGG